MNKRKPRKEKCPERATQEGIRRSVQNTTCSLLRKMSPKVKKFVSCLLLYPITFSSPFLMHGQRFREVVCQQLEVLQSCEWDWGKYFLEQLWFFKRCNWWFFLLFFSQETKQVFVTMVILNNYSSSPNGLWVNSLWGQGRIGYWLRVHESERNICFSKI